MLARRRNIDRAGNKAAPRGDFFLRLPSERRDLSYTAPKIFELLHPPAIVATLIYAIVSVSDLLSGWLGTRLRLRPVAVCPARPSGRPIPSQAFGRREWMPTAKEDAFATGGTSSKEETSMRTVKRMMNGFLRLNSDGRRLGLRDESEAGKPYRRFAGRMARAARVYHFAGHRRGSGVGIRARGGQPKRSGSWRNNDDHKDRRPEPYIPASRAAELHGPICRSPRIGPSWSWQQQRPTGGAVRFPGGSRTRSALLRPGRRG